MLLPIESVASLKQVDTGIFTLRYFGHCMQCTYCGDGLLATLDRGLNAIALASADPKRLVCLLP